MHEPAVRSVQREGDLIERHTHHHSRAARRMPVRCHLLSSLYWTPKTNRSIVYHEPQPATRARVPGMDGVPSAAGEAWLYPHSGHRRRQHAHEPAQLDWEAGRRALEEADQFMKRTPAHANIKKGISALATQRCTMAKGECSVCLMDMEVGEMVRTLKCGHLFHVGCECKIDSTPPRAFLVFMSVHIMRAAGVVSHVRRHRRLALPRSATAGPEVPALQPRPHHWPCGTRGRRQGRS